MPRVRCRRPAGGVPGPRARAGRPAGRLPRRAGRDAGPAAGDRRGRRLLPRHERELGRRVHDQPSGPTRWSTRRTPRSPTSSAPPRPDEIKFGANMSTPDAPPRALDRGDPRAGRRDRRHDASTTRRTSATWRAMAADRGVTVQTVDIDPTDVTLDLEDLESKLGAADEARRGRLRQQRGRHDQPGPRHRRPGPRGRRADLRRRRRVRAARPDRRRGPRHRLPRLLGLQVVRAAPRACCTARPTSSSALPVFKVRPAHDRCETGTPNFEAHRRHARRDRLPARRRARLRRRRRRAGRRRRQRAPARAGRRRWSPSPTTSATLVSRLIDGLEAIVGVTIHGITDPARFGARVPTVVGLDRGRPPAGGRGGARRATASTPGTATSTRPA